MRSVISCVFSCLLSLVAPIEAKKWVVFYGSEATPAVMNPYSLLVFDSQSHPPLASFIGSEKTLLGYLSLGEIHEAHPHFKELKHQGLLLQENPSWPASHMVDLRDPRWAKRVIEELIPAILFQRFNGIFIDTLDDADYLETQDPANYRGMRKAAIDLIKAIRLHYPHIRIMLNRGLRLLPEIAGELDMVVGESLYTTYDFKEQRYHYVQKEVYQQQIAILKQAKRNHPNLELYTLDYWDPFDEKAIREIYRVQRSQGLNPYVATIHLNEIVPEPR